MTAPPKLRELMPLFIPSALALAAALPLALSAAGLPLDDAYIFRRYAENLALGRGFAFNPGETSFGCTSFLWPVLVSFFIRYLGVSAYLAVVQSLGILAYAAAVFLTGAITLELTRNRLFALAAGMLAFASPALFMNAVSGMETPLFAAETALLGWLCVRFGFRPIWLGLIAAALFLTRPEGLLPALLIPPAFLVSRQAAGRKLIPFLLAFLIPVSPYLLFVHHSTGSFLPTTYLGKIMAADPGLLHRPWPEKVVFALFSLADGWNKLLAPLQLLGWILLAATLYLGLATLSDLLKKPKAFSPGLLVIILLIFWPAAYGFSFPVSPPFGGYYQRYIAAVMVSFAIGGSVGLFRFYHATSAWLAKRWPRLDQRRILFPAGFAVLIVYLGLGFMPQWQEGKNVFLREVSLNEGLRRSAAQWIQEHTPPDARVLVGYTGLGVVGGNCDRRVFDLGALINPDIFSYYQGTKPLTQKRWERILDYIDDRGIAWYVTFHYPAAPDPANSAGFQETARLGSSGEPKTPYEQVRIYRISRPRPKILP